MFLGRNPIAPYLGKYAGIVLNKYFVVFIVFLVWVAFFDKHSFLTNYKLNQTLKSLETENLDYQNQIVATEAEIKEHNQDLEKFAREKYYFQKENEDVFVVVKK